MVEMIADVRGYRYRYHVHKFYPPGTNLSASFSLHKANTKRKYLLILKNHTEHPTCRLLTQNQPLIQQLVEQRKRRPDKNITTWISNQNSPSFYFYNNESYRRKSIKNTHISS